MNELLIGMIIKSFCSKWIDSIWFLQTNHMLSDSFCCHLVVHLLIYVDKIVPFYP
jgi:hypothetical protein